MWVFHPAHRTASSRRTSGMPLLPVSGDGNIGADVRTRKEAGYIEVPDSASWLLWMYWSNSGRKSVYLLEACDGLPEIAAIDQSADDPQAVKRLASRLGIPPESEFEHRVIAFLWGRS